MLQIITQFRCTTIFARSVASRTAAWSNLEENENTDNRRDFQLFRLVSSSLKRTSVIQFAVSCERISIVFDALESTKIAFFLGNISYPCGLKTLFGHSPKAEKGVESCKKTTKIAIYHPPNPSGEQAKKLAANDFNGNRPKWNGKDERGSEMKGEIRFIVLHCRREKKFQGIWEFLECAVKRSKFVT